MDLYSESKRYNDHMQVCKELNSITRNLLELKIDSTLKKDKALKHHSEKEIKKNDNETVLQTIEISKKYTEQFNNYKHEINEDNNAVIKENENVEDLKQIEEERRSEDNNARIIKLNEDEEKEIQKAELKIPENEIRGEDIEEKSFDESKSKHKLTENTIKADSIQTNNEEINRKYTKDQCVTHKRKIKHVQREKKENNNVFYLKKTDDEEINAKYTTEQSIIYSKKLRHAVEKEIMGYKSEIDLKQIEDEEIKATYSKEQKVIDKQKFKNEIKKEMQKDSENDILSDVIRAKNKEVTPKYANEQPIAHKRKLKQAAEKEIMGNPENNILPDIKQTKDKVTAHKYATDESIVHKIKLKLDVDEEMKEDPKNNIFPDVEQMINEEMTQKTDAKEQFVSHKRKLKHSVEKEIKENPKNDTLFNDIKQFNDEKMTDKYGKEQSLVNKITLKRGVEAEIKENDTETDLKKTLEEQSVIHYKKLKNALEKEIKANNAKTDIKQTSDEEIIEKYVNDQSDTHNRKFKHTAEKKIRESNAVIELKQNKDGEVHRKYSKEKSEKFKHVEKIKIKHTENLIQTKDGKIKKINTKDQSFSYNNKLGIVNANIEVRTLILQKEVTHKVPIKEDDGTEWNEDSLPYNASFMSLALTANELEEIEIKVNKICDNQSHTDVEKYTILRSVFFKEKVQNLNIENTSICLSPVYWTKNLNCYKSNSLLLNTNELPKLQFPVKRYTFGPTSFIAMPLSITSRENYYEDSDDDIRSRRESYDRHAGVNTTEKLKYKERQQNFDTDSDPRHPYRPSTDSLPFDPDDDYYDYRKSYLYKLQQKSKKPKTKTGTFPYEPSLNSLPLDLENAGNAFGYNSNIDDLVICPKNTIKVCRRDNKCAVKKENTEPSPRYSSGRERTSRFSLFGRPRPSDDLSQTRFSMFGRRSARPSADPSSSRSSIFGRRDSRPSESFNNSRFSLFSKRDSRLSDGQSSSRFSFFRRRSSAEPNVFDDPATEISEAIGNLPIEYCGNEQLQPCGTPKIVPCNDKQDSFAPKFVTCGEEATPTNSSKYVSCDEDITCDSPKYVPCEEQTTNKAANLMPCEEEIITTRKIIKYLPSDKQTPSSKYIDCESGIPCKPRINISNESELIPCKNSKSVTWRNESMPRKSSLKNCQNTRIPYNSKYITCVDDDEELPYESGQYMPYNSRKYGADEDEIPYNSGKYIPCKNEDGEVPCNSSRYRPYKNNEGYRYNQTQYVVCENDTRNNISNNTQKGTRNNTNKISRKNKLLKYENEEDNEDENEAESKKKASNIIFLNIFNRQQEEDKTEDIKESSNENKPTGDIKKEKKPAEHVRYVPHDCGKKRSDVIIKISSDDDNNVHNIQTPIIETQSKKIMKEVNRNDSGNKSEIVIKICPEDFETDEEKRFSCGPCVNEEHTCESSNRQEIVIKICPEDFETSEKENLEYATSIREPTKYIMFEDDQPKTYIIYGDEKNSNEPTKYIIHEDEKDTNEPKKYILCDSKEKIGESPKFIFCQEADGSCDPNACHIQDHTKSTCVIFENEKERTSCDSSYSCDPYKYIIDSEHKPNCSVNSYNMMYENNPRHPPYMNDRNIICEPHIYIPPYHNECSPNCNTQSPMLLIHEKESEKCNSPATVIIVDDQTKCENPEYPYPYPFPSYPYDVPAYPFQSDVPCSNRIQTSAPTYYNDSSGVSCGELKQSSCTTEYETCHQTMSCNDECEDEDNLSCDSECVEDIISYQASDENSYILYENFEFEDERKRIDDTHIDEGCCTCCSAPAEREVVVETIFREVTKEKHVKNIAINTRILKTCDPYMCPQDDPDMCDVVEFKCLGWSDPYSARYECAAKDPNSSEGCYEPGRCTLKSESRCEKKQKCPPDKTKCGLPDNIKCGKQVQCRGGRNSSKPCESGNRFIGNTYDTGNRVVGISRCGQGQQQQVKSMPSSSSNKKCEKMKSCCSSQPESSLPPPPPPVIEKCDPVATCYTPPYHPRYAPYPYGPPLPDPRYVPRYGPDPYYTSPRNAPDETQGDNKVIVLQIPPGSNNNGGTSTQVMQYPAPYSYGQNMTPHSNNSVMLYGPQTNYSSAQNYLYGMPQNSNNMMRVPQAMYPLGMPQNSNSMMLSQPNYISGMPYNSNNSLRLPQQNYQFNQPMPMNFNQPFPRNNAPDQNLPPPNYAFDQNTYWPRYN